LVILVSQELEAWDHQVEQDPQGPLDPRVMENQDPREKGVLLENQAREDCLGDLDPLDPLGIVNSVTVLLPRQTNRPIKKALKLITVPGQALIGQALIGQALIGQALIGQALIGQARTAQLPMLQGRLPRILPRAWQPNWWQGHAQYHDYNQYYLFCAQYYNHVNPFIIDLNIHAYYKYTLMMKSLKYNPIFFGPTCSLICLIN
jgi:hypothetical protein